MTYDEEIHQLVNEFILDILLKNCEWILKWDDQEVIYAEALNDTLAEVKTINKRNGFVRVFLIQHTDGIPEKYGSQVMKVNWDGDWGWFSIPQDWRKK